MATITNIGTGTYPNDTTGDPLQTAFQKTNANFASLNTAIGTLPVLPGTYTYATLPAASANTGKTAYTSDQGPVYSNGVTWVQTGQQIFQAINVNPGNSAAVNQANLQAWVTLATAAGGGIIQLGSFSTPIPINNSSGPAITLGTSVAVGNSGADTPFNGVRIVGQGYQSANSRCTAGTVLQGTSTAYPIFAYNYIDNTVDYSSLGNFVGSWLQSPAITDLGMDTCSYGIKIGAKSKAGANFGLFKNLGVSNYSQWGFWFENFSESPGDQLETFNASTPGVGTIFIGSSAGAITTPGNCSFRDLIGNASGARGIVVQARTSAGGHTSYLNDLEMFHVGNTTAATTVSQAASGMTNGSPNITVTNAAAFPVDMPVFFTTYTNGFIQYQTYFVVSSNTGTNVITLSTQQGAAVQNANSNNTGTIGTYGWPIIEIVGYGPNAGNAIQSCSMQGVDAEAQGTCLILVSNAVIDMSMDTGTAAQGVMLASSFAARYSSGCIRSAYGSVLDFDGISSKNIIYLGSIDTTQAKPIIQGFSPTAIGYDTLGASAGLSLGSVNNQAIPWLLRTQAQVGTQAVLVPQVGFGQRVIVDTVNSSFTLDGANAGVTVFKASGAQSRTLPQLTVDGVSRDGAYGTLNGSTCGVRYWFFNASSNLLTVLANTTNPDNFNSNSVLTTLYIPPNACAGVLAMWNGTNQFWGVEWMSPTCGFNVDPTVSLQAPTTGFSITPAAGVLTLELNPAGTLATGTVTMPAAPVDNQQLVVMATQIVTALTVSANGGQTINNAPTAIAANTSFGYRYNASLSKWLRLY